MHGGAPSSDSAAGIDAVLFANPPQHDDEADLRSARVADLTQINLDDLVASFGCRNGTPLAGMARRLLRKPARKFARQIVEFDAAVGRHGLVNAACRTLPNYARDVRVFGRDHLPAGPFLALANHPGMTDTLALIGALSRPDLLVVALRRPFLQALPHTSRRLSCLSDEPFAHAAVVRKVGAHLRAGGAALSFPAGHIEPDPNAHRGAAQSLDSWAPSAGVFGRLAPDIALLPVLVRGVVWPIAAPRWPARRMPIMTDRAKAAAALQLLVSVVLKVRPVSVTVQIGRPIYAREFASAKSQVLHQAVLAEMSNLIRNPPDGRGELLA
jgi:hypothetical protein